MTLTGGLFCAQKYASFQAWEEDWRAEAGGVSVFKNVVIKNKTKIKLQKRKKKILKEKRKNPQFHKKPM